MVRAEIEAQPRQCVVARLPTAASGQSENGVGTTGSCIATRGVHPWLIRNNRRTIHRSMTALSLVRVEDVCRFFVRKGDKLLKSLSFYSPCSE
jgi:hypothetical protein